jgi:hypothetical protein
LQFDGPIIRLLFADEGIAAATLCGPWQTFIGVEEKPGLCPTEREGEGAAGGGIRPAPAIAAAGRGAVRDILKKAAVVAADFHAASPLLKLNAVPTATAR